MVRSYMDVTSWECISLCINVNHYLSQNWHSLFLITRGRSNSYVFLSVSTVRLCHKMKIKWMRMKKWKKMWSEAKTNNSMMKSTNFISNCRSSFLKYIQLSHTTPHFVVRPLNDNTFIYFLLALSIVTHFLLLGEGHISYVEKEKSWVFSYKSITRTCFKDFLTDISGLCSILSMLKQYQYRMSLFFFFLLGICHK